MGSLLRMVPNFGAFPDGRLRAGPFSVQTVGELYQAMDRWGIRPGAAGTQGMVSETSEGIMLSASGDGVMGYLLDTEALEVSISDLDAFIIQTVKPGMACRIDGHWCPDADRMIRSEALAVHDGNEVRWFETRDIFHRDGTRVNLKQSKTEAYPLKAVTAA